MVFVVADGAEKGTHPIGLLAGQGGSNRERKWMYCPGRELGLENEVELELNLPQQKAVL